MTKVDFPTRDNCDLDDPAEMFLHLLVAWPMGEIRIAFPVVYLRKVSEQLHRLGAFMRCPECGHMQPPRKQWEAPAGSSPHWLSDPGRWMKPDGGQAAQTSKFDGVIPTRERCDLSEPREMFAWMLAGLPLMRGAPLLFDSAWAMDTSEHLFDGGAMLQCPCGYGKPADREYVPPTLSGPLWLTNPGEWVAPEEKPQVSLNAEIDASLAKMSTRQRAELFTALQRDEAGEDLPDTPAGNVVSRIPAPQKEAILRRLRET